MELDRERGCAVGSAGVGGGGLCFQGGGFRVGLRGQAWNWGGGGEGVGTERRFAWNDDSPSFRAVMPFASRSVIWWWVSLNFRLCMVCAVCGSRASLFPSP